MKTTDPILVEVRTTSTNDWTWAVTGIALLLLCGWAAVTGFEDGEGPVFFFEAMLGPTGMRAAAAFGASIAGICAWGGIWRLVDRRPALHADETGLWFHPSLYPGAVGWDDVEWIGITGRRPASINLRLKRRFWSTSRFLTGRNVTMNFVATGLGFETGRSRKAEAMVAAMRRWCDQAR